MNRFNTAILTALLILLPAAVFAAAKTVAVVPFKVNAEKDMSFLRDGIYDMLSSRLYKEGEVEVISRQRVEKALSSIGGAVTEANARDVGRLLGADFILFGSLTVLGNSVSVDSKMLDVSGAKPTISFFEQSEDAGGIVARVNQMAAEINSKMFGLGAVAKAPAAASQAQAGQPAAPDVHTHPEKMFRQQTGFGSEGRESPFVTEESGGREFSPKFWRSMTFNQVFNGIALGDVDGDGKVETVIITPKSVMIYRFNQQRFALVVDLQDMSGGVNIGVDVADINGNGIPEIFVTSLEPTRKGLASFVVEYDGKAFKKIVEKARWYYRVSDIPDRGKVLLGQEHRHEAPFKGKIEEMVWRNGQYEPDAEVLPNNRNVNVLGLAIGDLVESHQETVAAYDSLDHIKVFDGSGKELWRSAEKSGGTTLNYSGPKGQGEIEEPVYFTMRLIPYQDKDGKTKIYAVKNLDIAGLKLERFRTFAESQIMSFAWDGLGLAQQWTTRKISGCIRDFAVGDFDNDGRPELVAAVVLEEARVIGVTPKSTVIALKFVN